MRAAGDVLHDLAPGAVSEVGRGGLAEEDDGGKEERGGEEERPEVDENGGEVGDGVVGSGGRAEESGGGDDVELVPGHGGGVHREGEMGCEKGQKEREFKRGDGRPPRAALHLQRFLFFFLFLLEKDANKVYKLKIGNGRITKS